MPHHGGWYHRKTTYGREKWHGKTGSHSKVKSPFCFVCNKFSSQENWGSPENILIPTSDDVPYNSGTLHCPHLPTVPSSLKTPSRKLSFQQMNLWGPHPSHVQIMPTHILHIIYPPHVCLVPLCPHIIIWKPSCRETTWLDRDGLARRLCSKDQNPKSSWASLLCQQKWASRNVSVLFATVFL